MAGRRLIVFGPHVMAALIVAMLVAAVVLVRLDMRWEAGYLIVAIVTRMLPIARGRNARPEIGRKADLIKIVTRGKRGGTDGRDRNFGSASVSAGGPEESHEHKGHSRDES